MRSIEDILDSLIEATEDRKLAWERNLLRNYVARLPRHDIRIWEWQSENDGTSGVTVQLLDKSGDLLDEATADEYKPLFADLHRLFLGARRSAHNVTTAIDEIEEELAALKPAR